MEVNGAVEEEQPQLDQEPLKKGTASSSPTTSASGCFDCNICLDFAVDPVVTLCGHLYCWPCIYRWLQVESTSLQHCPVCKASLSQDSLVPLYGRGLSNKHSHQSLKIPNRPPSRHLDQTVPESDLSIVNENPPPGDLHTDIHHPMIVQRHRHQHYHLHQHEHEHRHYPLDDYLSSTQPSSSQTLGSTWMVHSTAGGVLGGMAIAVLPWVSRNHEDAMRMHYSSPFTMEANGSSPRLRRQEMEMEMSLHRIWLFLFCCVVLCLLLF